MAVERKKHYLTTKEYSVLTGPKTGFSSRRTNPKQVRTNMVKGTVSDPTSVKAIWNEFVKEIKDGLGEYK